MLGLYDAAVARIQERCPSVLQAQTGLKAAETAELLALDAEVTAIVAPLSDAADPIDEAGFMVSQRVVHLFGVTLALVFPGGIPQFETARAEINAALRGWSPEGASMPVAYAGGNLLDYSLGVDGGRLLWLLRYRVETQDTVEDQA